MGMDDDDPRSPWEQAREAEQIGIIMMTEPKDLGLPTLGHEGIVSVLLRYDRDFTVGVYCNVGMLLFSLGDSRGQVQRELIAKWLPEPARAKALALIDEVPTRVVITHEACVRLAALAMTHCPTTGGIDQGDEEAGGLLLLTPEVQAGLSRMFETDSAQVPRGSKEAFDEWAVTIFVGANTGGIGDDTRSMLNASTLGAIAVPFVAKHLDRKKLAQVNAAVHAAVSADHAEFFAACVHLVSHLSFNEVLVEKGKQPQVGMNAGAQRARGERLSAVVVRALEVGSAAPVEGLQLADALGPAACLQDGLRFRPFYQASRDPDVHLCWNTEMLHTMLGGMFPEWLRPALPIVEFEWFSGAWDRAVEDAIDQMVTPFVPSWGPPKVKGKNCDRIFHEDDDLFLVEVKNVKPSPGLLRRATPASLRAWLTDKFFNKGGFPQVYATLRQLDAQDRRIGSRRTSKYRAFWPIIVCWTRAPADPMFLDMLSSLVPPQQGMESVQSRLRGPLILSYDELLLITSLLPALRRSGLSLGRVLDGFMAKRHGRPFGLSMYITSLLGPTIVPDDVPDLMRKSMDWVREAGDRMRSEPSA